jgi:pantoate--beta-alanine ligase
LSLVIEAQKHYDIVVCSIFVNPTQFNDASDLAKYPRTLESDLKLLAAVQTTAVYFPEIEDVYPPSATAEHFEFGALEEVLEGAHRPGHFGGVGMVVSRLLRIVSPDGLMLGEKDYQQCLIIRNLVQQMGWKNRVQLHFCPTSREANGLAMSSRNTRLSEKAKQVAANLYLVLEACKERYPHLSPSELADWATHSLEVLPNTRVEYVAFADALTLQPVNHWNESEHIRVLIAAWVEDVRLIDNTLLF